jgi:hypothetical protein
MDLIQTIYPKAKEQLEDKINRIEIEIEAKSQLSLYEAKDISDIERDAGDLVALGLKYQFLKEQLKRYTSIMKKSDSNVSSKG